MRIAVTGSAGFIGQATFRNGMAHGHAMVGLDRRNGHDILSADLTRLFDGCDAVIHLAGMLGTSELLDALPSAIDVNVHGTRRVLDACRAVGAHYVGITVPDCWPSAYQATKLCAHRLADAYHDAYNVPVTHVRTFNAYGPGQAYGHGHPQKIIPTFAACGWNGAPLPIWGDGSQTVDLVHVSHVADCLTIAAVTEPGEGETWDCGSGVESSVLYVARLVMDVTGSRLAEFLPMRAGELPQTKLCAKDPGPFGFDTITPEKVVSVIESYRHKVTA